MNEAVDTATIEIKVVGDMRGFWVVMLVEDTDVDGMRRIGPFNDCEMAIACAEDLCRALNERQSLH
jgi:hypothetical protein